MIVKIISRKTPQSESDAAAMVRYVRAERPEDADGEKAVPGYGGNTFGAEEDEGELQLRHMLELMRSNPGCTKPLLHGMISWSEDDAGPDGPTPEQVKEAVHLWAAELGLSGLDMLWAVHGNTMNAHVHVLVCMVDPLTGKARHLVPYRKACQKAKARIEAAQGLQPCARDLYIPDPSGGGGIIPNPERWGKRQERPELAPLTPEAAALEQRHGVKPLQRRLQEVVPAALKKAGKDGWPAFHAALAEQGVEVRPAGRGMCFFLGTDGVKASNVSRKTSRRQLEKRLGAFEPALDVDLERASGIAAALPPEPSEDMADELLPYWEEYMRQRDAWLEESRRQSRERRAERRLLAERLQGELREAARLLKETRRKGRRLLRGAGAALRSALKVRGEARRRILRERLAETKKLSRKQFPDSFAAWLMAQGMPALAERWRMRGQMHAAAEAERERQTAD